MPAIMGVAMERENKQKYGVESYNVADIKSISLIHGGTIYGRAMTSYISLASASGTMI